MVALIKVIFTIESLTELVLGAKSKVVLDSFYSSNIGVHGRRVRVTVYSLHNISIFAFVMYITCNWI